MGDRVVPAEHLVVVVTLELVYENLGASYIDPHGSIGYAAASAVLTGTTWRAA